MVVVSMSVLILTDRSIVAVDPDTLCRQTVSPVRISTSAALDSRVQQNVSVSTHTETTTVSARNVSHSQKVRNIVSFTDNFPTHHCVYLVTDEVTINGHRTHSLVTSLI